MCSGAFSEPLLSTQAPGGGAAAAPADAAPAPRKRCTSRLRADDLAGLWRRFQERRAAAARLLLAAGLGYAAGWAQFSGVEVATVLQGAAVSALEVLRSGAWVPPESFFESAANLLTSCFFVSPAVQMVEVHRSRGASLDAVSPQTLVLMLLNCSLWAAWGLFAPMPPAVPGNAFGLTMAVCYLSFCWAHALRGRGAGSPRWGRAAGAGTLAMVGLVPAVFLYASLSRQCAQHIGYTAMFICILMYASPLSVLRQVVADRSSALLPPVQCFMQFMNCFVWMVVGINTRALPVLVCNVLGFALGTVQLGLIFLFPVGRPKDAHVTQIVDSNV